MNLDGVIVVDKPCGITSFKVVSQLRRLLNIKKIGHMGTLDPMATGVLPVMLGKATKALDLIGNHNKKYITKIKFGISTDTQDITGKILSRSSKKVVYLDFIQVLNKFKGEILQLPPMYSAIKKNGVKLYDLARNGQVVDREKRKVIIYNINVCDFKETEQEAVLCVECSRGTYIRSLCSDIGNELKCGATMTYLRRIMSNGFGIDKSLEMDEINMLCQNNFILDKIIPIECLFKDLYKIDVTSPQAVRFKNGGGLSLERIRNVSFARDGLRCAVYENGVFVGIGEVNVDKNELSVVKVFCT